MAYRNCTILFITLLSCLQCITVANAECYDKLCKLSNNEQKFNPSYLEKFKYFFNIEQPTKSVMVNRNEVLLDLCDEEEILFEPNYGESVDNKNLTIVNMEGFKQEIILRRCKNSNQVCNHLDVTKLDNFTPICKQGYITRLFVVYDPTIAVEAERFSTKEMKYESCCQCSAFDKQNKFLN